jgi:hypothetical protein
VEHPLSRLKDWASTVTYPAEALTGAFLTDRLNRRSTAKGSAIPGGVEVVDDLGRWTRRRLRLFDLCRHVSIISIGHCIR